MSRPIGSRPRSPNATPRRRSPRSAGYFPARVMDDQAGRGDGARRPRGVRLIVDGMNVIGSRPDRWWNDPDRAVRRMIEELDRYASATGDVVTVVFDRHPRDVEAGGHGAIEVRVAPRRGRGAARPDIREKGCAGGAP